MLIECDSCAMRDRRAGRGRESQGRPDGQSEASGCDDCVVNVLLAMPPTALSESAPGSAPGSLSGPLDDVPVPSVEVHEVGGVPLAEFDEAEQSAIALLAGEGLIAPLYPEPRYVPVGVASAADGRKAG